MMRDEPTLLCHFPAISSSIASSILISFSVHKVGYKAIEQLIQYKYTYHWPVVFAAHSTTMESGDVRACTPSFSFTA